ncbi:MAG: hypothetical protein JWN82_431 [Candidatus Saccharibacteria bacterium]|nr:hypothetical protein [Candidatus Saccharibacteria bacterium]
MTIEKMLGTMQKAAAKNNRAVKQQKQSAKKSK